MTPTLSPPAPTAAAAGALYAAHVNPQWVHLLRVLDMDESYARCTGTELWTTDGRCILDFLSGYGVYNTGHNHPAVVGAVIRELRRDGPTMLQSHIPELAAQLAARLVALGGGRLEKVFFTSSGSEGVETVIKFARQHTGRPGILYAGGAFHGLTCGALSLMGESWWRQGFGPLLPGTQEIPFGDLKALDAALADGQQAVFIVEPVQAEAGVRLPPADYLSAAAEICHRHGTLLALDEVQTGLHRTGPFLAAHTGGVDVDMVVLAKALSGGLVPVGAVLMSEAVHGSVYSSLSRAFIHASTFGENALAMRAGLATLEVLEEEQLGARAVQCGESLRQQLRQRLEGMEMVESVRGAGLLSGIVFRPPDSWRRRGFYRAFNRVHAGMFGQMLVSRLFRHHQILTQMCGNAFNVLKVAPPLTVGAAQMATFVEAVGTVLDEAHGGSRFWTGGLAMIPRALRL